MEKIKEMIKNPRLIVNYFLNRKPFRKMSDKRFLLLKYFIQMGEKLDLENPKTFNEKLQWMKLNDRNPLYTKLVDKYEVREFIAEKVGEEYLIPLYGVYEKFNDINFDELPNQFVLKANHTSGDYYICKDKRQIDYKMLEAKVNKWLEREYYWVHREWPYKNVTPKIIVEKYISTNSNENIRDYRFFCFNGEPKFISMDIDIIDKTQTKRNIYDLEWNLLNIEISYPREKEYKVPKPKNLDKMIQIARKLSEDIPHVRVDLYNIEGTIYFGEMTFYHQSGYSEISPEAYNVEIGNWINIV